MNGTIESQNQRRVQDVKEDLIILPQRKHLIVGVVNISQSEIQKFLESHKGEWFTVKELAKRMGITTGSCLNNLLRLRKHRMVEVKKSIYVNNAFEYRYKERPNMIRNRPLSIKELKEEFEKCK